MSNNWWSELPVAQKQDWWSDLPEAPKAESTAPVIKREMRAYEPGILERLSDLLPGDRARAMNEVAVQRIAERDNVTPESVYSSVGGSRPAYNPEGDSAISAAQDEGGKMLRGLSRVPGAIKRGGQMGAGGLARIVGESSVKNPISPELHERIRAKNPKIAAELKWEDAPIMPGVAEWGGDLYEKAQKEAKATTPKDQSFMEEAIVSAGQSVGQALPTLGAAALTRNPTAVGTALFGAQETSRAYGEARDKGLPRDEAVPYAIRNGLIEAGTERAAIGALFKKDPSFGKKLVNFLAREIPGENVAEISQEVNSMLSGVSPKTTVGEFISSLPRMIALTTTSTILGGGAQAGVMHGAQKIAEKIKGGNPVETKPDNQFGATQAPDIDDQDLIDQINAQMGEDITPSNQPPSPDTQVTETPDILNKAGQPFQTRQMAELYAKVNKLTEGQPVNVGVNQWVLRRPAHTMPDGTQMAGESHVSSTIGEPIDNRNQDIVNQAAITPEQEAELAALLRQEVTPNDRDESGRLAPDMPSIAGQEVLGRPIPVEGRSNGVATQPGQTLSKTQEVDTAPPAKPADNLVKMKDVYGVTVNVMQSDIDSGRSRLPTYTIDGKRKGGSIHRENLDPTGAKLAGLNAENETNPLFDVITSKDGRTFSDKASAQRVINSRSIGGTHEVIEAGQIQDGLNGYLLRRKRQGNQPQEQAPEDSASPLQRRVPGEKVDELSDRAGIPVNDADTAAPTAGTGNISTAGERVRPSAADRGGNASASGGGIPSTEGGQRVAALDGSRAANSQPALTVIEQAARNHPSKDKFISYLRGRLGKTKMDAQANEIEQAWVNRPSQTQPQIAKEEPATLPAKDGVSPQASVPQAQIGGNLPIKPSEEIARRVQAETPDRRRDPAARKKISEMSDIEMRRALLIDDMTGLGNRRAYEESDKLPFQASIDADALKWINDNLSPEAGDKLLTAIGHAIGDETPNGYHISGDEYYIQGQSQEEIDSIMGRVQDKLKSAVITIEKPDGTLVEKRGIEVTYGAGKDKNTADAELKQRKRDREAAGLRAARGERPAGVVEIPAKGKQDSGREVSEEVGGQPLFSREKSLFPGSNRLSNIDKNGGMNRRAPSTEAFKEWSGRYSKSKARGIFYHKTKGDFTVFDTSRGDLGAHFGTLTQAEGVARLEGNGEGANIMPVRLAIRNPLRLKDTGSFHADATAGQLVKKGVISKELAAKINSDIKGDWTLRKKYNKIVREAIQDKGYDGVVYANEHEGAGDSWIAFEPTQIKSAIGNSGDYDPKNPDIRYSRDSIETPALRHGSTESVTSAILGAHTGKEKEAIQAMMDAVKVRVVTLDQAAAVVGDDALSLGENEALAFFNPADGITYFIADNMRKDMTPQEIKGLVRHEISVHALQLGKDSKEFKDILKSLDVMRRAGNKKVIEAHQRAKDAGTREADVSHEQLAYLVQHSPDLPIVRRFVAWLKNAIRNLGKDFPIAQKLKIHAWANTITVNDVLYMAQTALAKSYKAGDVEVRTKERGGVLAAVVYHGSPHKFDKFDMSKIGTGEGAQAYGHGLYFAESPEVAQGYKKALSGYAADGKTLPGNVGTVVSNYGGDIAAVLADKQGQLDKWLASGADKNHFIVKGLQADIAKFSALKGKSLESTGSLYKVDIPDEAISRMLDWDKPLSEQGMEVQPVLRDMLSKARKSFPGIDPNGNPIAGQIHHLYAQHRGGNANAVSDELRQAGIPGIRYLDGNSRGVGGTSNYVLFDDSLPRILEINGVPTGAVSYADESQASKTLYSMGPGSNVPLFSRATFYSQLSRVIEKAPDNVFKNAAQAKLWLASNAQKLSVKKDEMHWSGVLDWLDMKGNEKISKADVIDYLQDNGVTVEEVEISDDGSKRWDVLDDESNHLDSFRSREDAKKFADDQRENFGGEYIIRQVDGTGDAKYSKHAPPGGKPGTYRELLLTLPEVKTSQQDLDKNFRSSHFDQPNILAHLRVDEVEGLNGERLLRVVEAQSDWGQKGRKEGFKTGARDTSAWHAELQPSGRYSVTDESGKWMGNYSASTPEEAILAAADARPDERIPSAPFVTDTQSWLSLALKKAISYAAENGMDGIVFATGQQNADLYDLSKRIEEISYSKNDHILRVISVDGKVVINEKTAPGKLPDIIGKEVADKIAKDAGTFVRMTGLDLKVGGEGMKAFYDKIVPQVADKVLKQIGADAKVIDIAIKDGNHRGFMITPTISDKAAQGLPLFSRSPAKTADDVVIRDEAKTAEKDIAHALNSLANGFTRDQLVEMYGEELPSLSTYKETQEQRETERTTLLLDADRLYNKMLALPSEQMDSLADIAAEATLSGYDPADPKEPATLAELKRLAEDLRKRFKDTGKLTSPQMKLMLQAEKRIKEAPIKHAELQKRYDALSDEAKDVYVAARDKYTDRGQKVFNAVRDRISRMNLPAHVAKKAIEDLRVKFDKTLSGVYFPLARFGDIIVSGTLNGKPVVEYYESEREARRALAKMKADGITDAVIRPKKENTNTFTKNKTLDEIVKIISESASKAEDGLPSEALELLMDNVNQALIRAVPDMSYRRHWMHRKGVPGYSRDFIRAYSDSMSKSANHISSIMYDDRIHKAIVDMEKEADTAAPELRYALGDIVNHFKKREDELAKPVSNITATIGQVGFISALGSISSGMVNLTQLGAVTMPYLMARYGAGAALRLNADFAITINHITKAFGKTALTTKTLGESLDITTAMKDGVEKRLMTKLYNMDKINRTFALDLIHAANHPSEQLKNSKSRRVIDSAMLVAAIPQHVSEVANRVTTALTVIKLEMAKSGNEEKALLAAIEAIDKTHFNYGAENRALVMHGNVARVVTMFKQYAQNMAYLWGRTAWLAVKDKDPETRSIARKQMAYMAASQSLIGGVLGLPLGVEAVGVAGGMIGFKLWGSKGAYAMGITSAIAAGMLSGGWDDDEEDMEIEFRKAMAELATTHLGEDKGKAVAEIVSRGAFRMIFPGDIAGRVDQSELFIRKPDPQMEGQDAYYAWMTSALGYSVGYGAQVAQGAKLITDGEVYRGAEKIIPFKQARDAMKAYRYETEGTLTLKGDNLLSESDPNYLKWHEITTQAVGFTPRRLAESYEGNTAVRRAEKGLTKQRQDIMDDLKKAYRKGDQAAIDGAYARMGEFVTKNPSFYMDVSRSLAADERNRGMAEGGLVISPKHGDLRKEGDFANR